MQQIKERLARLDIPWPEGTGGIVFILAAMLGLSLAPTFIKWGIAADDGPIPLLAMRLLIGAGVLWVVVLAYQPGLARIDRRGLRACAIVAVTNSVSLSCFYLALDYISASLATVIFALHPLVVLLILATLGEPLTRRKLVRLALALVGIVLLLGINGTVQWAGVALAGGTAVFYAAYLVLIQEQLGSYPAPQTTLYVISMMAGILGVVFLIQLLSGTAELAFSGTGWITILFTGLVSTAFARFALFAGIQRVGGGQAALLGPIETMLVVFWAVILLGERLSLTQSLGGALILISAALAAPRRRRPPQSASKL